MLNKIQNDIKSTFYIQNFPNDGQRFVAWYLKNIYHLSDILVKDSVTDGKKINRLMRFILTMTMKRFISFRENFILEIL